MRFQILVLKVTANHCGQREKLPDRIVHNRHRLSTWFLGGPWVVLVIFVAGDRWDRRNRAGLMGRPVLDTINLRLVRWNLKTLTVLPPVMRRLSIALIA